jgi:hypothetical protein
MIDFQSQLTGVVEPPSFSQRFAPGISSPGEGGWGLSRHCVATADEGELNRSNGREPALTEILASGSRILASTIRLCVFAPSREKSVFIGVYPWFKNHFYQTNPFRKFFRNHCESIKSKKTSVILAQKTNPNIGADRSILPKLANPRGTGATEAYARLNEARRAFPRKNCSFIQIFNGFNQFLRPDILYQHLKVKVIVKPLRQNPQPQPLAC